jgi:hypothetical protein
MCPRGRPKGSKNKNTIKLKGVGGGGRIGLIADLEELEEQEENEDEEAGESGLVIGNGEYRLTTSKLNVILQTRTKNGTYTNWKYFADPHNALEYILKHELLKTGFEDLKALYEKINEVCEWIKGIPNNTLPQIKIQ